MLQNNRKKKKESRRFVHISLRHTSALERVRMHLYVTEQTYYLLSVVNTHLSDVPEALRIYLYVHHLISTPFALPKCFPILISVRVLAARALPVLMLVGRPSAVPLANKAVGESASNAPSSPATPSDEIKKRFLPMVLHTLLTDFCWRGGTRVVEEEGEEHSSDVDFMPNSHHSEGTDGRWRESASLRRLP